MLARGAKDKEYAMYQNFNDTIAVIGIEIGKNSFHAVGLDSRVQSHCGSSRHLVTTHG